MSQSIAHGQINWTDKKITVTGSAAPNLKAANAAVARLGAERAAKIDAFRNALEAVRGVRITGKGTAGDLMSSSSRVSSSVEGIVRGFKVIDTKYYSDGAVDLVVQVPLGDIALALVPDGGGRAPAGGSDGSWSGVVVNAKGLRVTPALAPQLLDEEGNVVFSASMVARDTLRERGMVAYLKDIKAAKNDARVGSQPLLLRAKRPAEEGSADIVIASSDAAKLATLRMVILKGKVVIVTD